MSRSRIGCASSSLVCGQSSEELPRSSPSSRRNRRVPAAADSSAKRREPAEVLSVSEVTLDLDRHECTVREKEVGLPLKEFELLEQLLTNAGRVVARDTLDLSSVGGGLRRGHKDPRRPYQTTPLSHRS